MVVIYKKIYIKFQQIQR